ncbi:MAG: hypothetical protein SH868_14790 [Bythopirellula sp.]|nr:hypothetical protein [Bythopirellula sp.]
MSQQVEAILQQIESLDETDRLALEERLQEISETEWKQETESARVVARQQGIDQQSIDEAIDNLRYGA